MRLTINNVNILRDRVLRPGDTVNFSIPNVGEDYRVRGDHLFIWTDSNGVIFTVLGIDDRRSFAAGYYGYEAGGGAWPGARMNDYEATTRLVRALFDVRLTRIFTAAQ